MQNTTISDRSPLGRLSLVATAILGNRPSGRFLSRVTRNAYRLPTRRAKCPALRILLSKSNKNLLSEPYL